MLLNPHGACCLQRRLGNPWAQGQLSQAEVPQQHWGCSPLQPGHPGSLCPAAAKFGPPDSGAQHLPGLHPLSVLPQGSPALAMRCRLSGTDCPDLPSPESVGFPLAESRSRGPIPGPAPSLLLADPLPASPTSPWHCWSLQER